VRLGEDTLSYSKNGKTYCHKTVEVTCDCCGKKFKTDPYELGWRRKKNNGKIDCSSQCGRRKIPLTVPERVLVEETIKEYGHDPRLTGYSNRKKIITECAWCSKITSKRGHQLTWDAYKYCSRSCSVAAKNNKGKVRELAPWIDRDKTIEKFGYNPVFLGEKSAKLVVRICQSCKQERDMTKCQAREFCEKCISKESKVRKFPVKLPDHILIKETIEQTGEDPRFFYNTSKRPVVVKCRYCGNISTKLFCYALAHFTCSITCEADRRRFQKETDPETINLINEEVKLEEILLMSYFYHSGTLFIKNKNKKHASYGLIFGDTNTKHTKKNMRSYRSRDRIIDLLRNLNWEFTVRGCSVSVNKYTYTQRFSKILGVSMQESASKSEVIDKIIDLLLKSNRHFQWAFVNELITASNDGLRAVGCISTWKGGNPSIQMNDQKMRDRLKNLFEQAGFGCGTYNHCNIFCIVINRGALISGKNGAQRGPTDSGWKPFKLD